MPCRQIFSAKLPNGSNATSYLAPTFGYTWSTAAIVGVPWQTAGSFKNVSITHASAPGSGKTFVYTFVKNGVDTALVVTIADLATTGSNTTDAVAVVPGDVVYWKRTTTGTPTASVQQVAGEFWGTVIGESGYGNYGSISNTATWRNTVFNQGLWNTTTLAGGNFEVVAAAGNLTAIAITLGAAPGTGKSYAITLYKNAVKQDGSGGTVNTTITIADSATTGSWSGTLALVAGDYVTFESVPTGSPAVVADMACGVKFVATTDGESQGGLNAKAVGIPTISSTYYSCPDFYCQSGVYAWAATESTVETKIPPGLGVTIRGLRVRLSNTVQTGPITFTLRKNTADTALTATLTSTQQTGADSTNSVALAAGDAWAVKYVNPGTPGSARQASVNFVIYALIEVEEECVFLTTTRTDRAVFSDRAAIGTTVLPVDSVLSLGDLPARGVADLVLAVDADGEVTAGLLTPIWVAVSLGGSRAASLPLAAATYELVNAEPAFTVPTMNVATARIVADCRSLDTTASVTPRLVNASTAVVAGTGTACTASAADYSGTNQHQTIAVTVVSGQTYKAEAIVAGAGAATYATFCTIRLEIG